MAGGSHGILPACPAQPGRVPAGPPASSMEVPRLPDDAPAEELAGVDGVPVLGPVILMPPSGKASGVQRELRRCGRQSPWLLSASRGRESACGLHGGGLSPNPAVLACQDFDMLQIDYAI